MHQVLVRRLVTWLLEGEGLAQDPGEVCTEIAAFIELGRQEAED